MYSKWTQHLKDPNEKIEFGSSVQGSKRVLDRLKTIFTELKDELDRSEMDIKSFDQPNWSERQAFKNGYRSSLCTAIKLVDLDQQQLPKENS